MSSSQAYLGSFESQDEIKMTVTKEVVESFLSSMNMEDMTIETWQWNEIWSRVYDSDLVSDFFEGILKIATAVTEGE
jgi:hypothetical protein